MFRRSIKQAINRSKTNQTDDASAMNAFTVLKTGVCPAPIVLCSWCPSRDLCCLITCQPPADETEDAEWQLHIHRLNWQLLYTVDIDWCDSDDRPTALVWRPDGLALAVGSSRGEIRLFCTESRSFKLSHPSAINATPITHLQWIILSLPQTDEWQHVADASLYSMPMSCYEPTASTDDESDSSTSPFEAPLPCLPAAPPSALQQTSTVSPDTLTGIDTSTRSILTDASFTQCTLLLSGDANGRIAAFMHGTLHILQLQCPLQNLTQSQMQLTSLSCAANLTSIAVTYQSMSASTELKSQQTHSMLQQFSLYKSLHARCHELHWLFLLHQRCTRLTQYASAVIDRSVKQRWSAIHKALRFKFGALNDIMYDEIQLDRTQHSVVSEYLTLLLTGLPSRAMYQFMTRTLTVSSVDKLALLIDSHLQQMQRGVNECLLPAVEECIQHVNRLYAFAYMQERNDLIGLSTHSIARLSSLLQHLHTQSHSLLMALTKRRHSCSSFMDWLSHSVHSVLGTEEADDAAKQVYDGPFDNEAVVEFVKQMMNEQTEADEIACVINGSSNQRKSDPLFASDVSTNSLGLLSCIEQLSSGFNALSRCAETLSIHTQAVQPIELCSSPFMLECVRHLEGEHECLTVLWQGKSLTVTRHGFDIETIDGSVTAHSSNERLNIALQPDDDIAQLAWVDDDHFAVMMHLSSKDSENIHGDSNGSIDIDSELRVYDWPSIVESVSDDVWEYIKWRIFVNCNVRQVALGAERGVAALLMQSLAVGVKPVDQSRVTSSIEFNAASLANDSQLSKCMLIDVREDEEVEEQVQEPEPEQEQSQEPEPQQSAATDQTNVSMSIE